MLLSVGVSAATAARTRRDVDSFPRDLYSPSGNSDHHALLRRVRRRLALSREQQRKEDVERDDQLYKDGVKTMSEWSRAQFFKWALQAWQSPKLKGKQSYQKKIANLHKAVIDQAFSVNDLLGGYEKSKKILKRMGFKDKGKIIEAIQNKEKEIRKKQEAIQKKQEAIQAIRRAAEEKKEKEKRIKSENRKHKRLTTVCRREMERRLEWKKDKEILSLAIMI